MLKGFNQGRLYHLHCILCLKWTVYFHIHGHPIIDFGWSITWMKSHILMLHSGGHWIWHVGTVPFGWNVSGMPSKLIGRCTTQRSASSWQIPSLKTANLAECLMSRGRYLGELEPPIWDTLLCQLNTLVHCNEMCHYWNWIPVSGQELDCHSCANRAELIQLLADKVPQCVE